MKQCPTCNKSYPDASRFCSVDGTPLAEAEGEGGSTKGGASQREIPPPPQPLPMRMTIIDQGDEDRRSRVIVGQVLDLGTQGLRIKTGTVETGQLNLIRDHTVAFKNKLEIEFDTPGGTIRCTGFASWYRQAGDSVNWLAGIYIRDMPAADREKYDAYLDDLAGGGTP